MKLKIDGFLNHMGFSAAHFIPTIEKCSHLHGHNYSVEVTVDGTPVDGILMDYGILKGICRRIVDRMDHRVLVPRKSKFSSAKVEGDSIVVTYGERKFVFPVQDVYFLDREMSSSEMISDFIAQEIKNEIFSSRNIEKLTVCVYESPGQCACSEVVSDY